MTQLLPISNLFERALERPMRQILPTNIVETDDGFTLSVKVPGVSRKSIAVDILGRIVKISVNTTIKDDEKAAKQESSLSSPRSVHLVEFDAPVKAERAFEFRDALDAEAATLDFTDGILTLSVGYQMRGSKRTLTLNA